MKGTKEIGEMIKEMEKVDFLNEWIGVQIYANGDKYEGEWLNNLKEGNGTSIKNW